MNLQLLPNYVISYSWTRDKNGEEYHALLTDIERLGGWEFHDTSCATHLVQSTLSAKDLYEQLIDHFVGPNDKLLIAEFGPPAWHNLQPDEFAIQRLRAKPSRPPKTSPPSEQHA